MLDGVRHAVEWMTGDHKLRRENERLRTIIRHVAADRTGVYFICGDDGSRGDQGLPEVVHICPVYGADVGNVHRYRRER